MGDELRSVHLRSLNQLCLSHVRANMLKRMIKEVKKRALVFTDSLDFFFRKERDYNEENLILEERV